MQRELTIGDFRETSDDHQALTGFVGFELKNSMLFLQFRSEEADFANGVLPYERQEASVEWHWNETTEKDNYVNTTFGFFSTSYSAGPLINEDFLGISLGAGGTKDLGRLFLTGTFKLKLPYTDDPKFLKDSEESRFFFGYEVKAAVGVYFDSEGKYSLQIGYRSHEVDFDGLFIDDSSRGPFVSARIFISSD